MSMRILACALAAAAIAGGVAAARTVSTGTTAKLSRKASYVKMAAYWSSGYGDKLDIVVYPSFIAEGDEFDVVDSEGYVGRVRVDEAHKTNQGCPKFTYMRASATFLEKPARDTSYSTRIAFGPLPDGRDRPTRAKLHEGGYGRSTTTIRGLPPPGAAQGLAYAVDLDGDGAVDLARYIYDCAGGHDHQYNANSDGCVDDWVRDAAGNWVLGDNGKFRCH